MNKYVIFPTKYFKLTIIAIFFFGFLNAQEMPKEEKVKSDFWENVYFGGGIGLSFGNGYTNVALAPSAIYKFNAHFLAGAGLSGNYSRRRDFFKATVFGGSLIGIFRPIHEVQISLEFEQNNVDLRDDIDSSIRRNYWYQSLFVGGGYTIGDFGAVGVRYDVLYDEDKSIYGSAAVPFVRVYF